MSLLYSRPWLLEIEDQPWCPSYLRDPVRDMLTFLWTHRIPPFQQRPPYEGAAEVLEQILYDVENEGGVDEQLSVIDFGSGAGGPLKKIERFVNLRRTELAKQPIQFYLSDINPMPSSLPASTPSTLSYMADSVNALCAPDTVTSQRHLRTFFLSYHHFNEDKARRIIVDAIKSAEGLCIFELQEWDLASLIMVIMIAPITWLTMPFQSPSLKTLFFTYIIPLIPLILVFDGIVSVYRTRPPRHILHLANLASLSLALEGGYKDNDGLDWKWEFGSRRHTWPFGKMVWVVGRTDTKGDGAATETEGRSEAGFDLGKDDGDQE